MKRSIQRQLKRSSQRKRMSQRKRSSQRKRMSQRKRKSLAKCMRNKVGFIMKEFKNKSLKLRSGKTVKDRKQAIAIALSIGRKSCELKQRNKKYTK